MVLTNRKCPKRKVVPCQSFAVELTRVVSDASTIARDDGLRFATLVFQAGGIPAHNRLRATFMPNKYSHCIGYYKHSV